MLGLSSSSLPARRWTEEEKEWLVNNINNYSTEDIGYILNRIPSCVLTKSWRMRIRKIKNIRTIKNNPEAEAEKDNLRIYFMFKSGRSIKDIALDMVLHPEQVEELLKAREVDPSVSFPACGLSLHRRHF